MTWVPMAPTATRPASGRAAAAPFPRNATAAAALAGAIMAERESAGEAADAELQNCLQVGRSCCDPLEMHVHSPFMHRICRHKQC